MGLGAKEMEQARYKGNLGIMKTSVKFMNTGQYQSQSPEIIPTNCQLFSLQFNSMNTAKHHPHAHFMMVRRRKNADNNHVLKAPVKTEIKHAHR